MPRDFAPPALALLLAFTLLASCSDRLQLVVVEQGGNGGVSVAAQAGAVATSAGATSAGATAGKPTGGGSPALMPMAGAGTLNQGGSTEPATGGAAGSPDENAGAAGAVTTPPAVWDAPPRYTASFVSHAFPGQYIRYIEDKGFIAAIDMASMTDREQASFDMIPGLYDAKCSSFRALNKPATLFRHSGSRLYMNPASSEPLFLADATFCEEEGMADAAGVTFRSVNYPQRVIHLRNQNELWIDDVPNPTTPEFASEATFYRQAALVEASSL